MKSRKSHYRQTPYYAYSTYIQPSNQAIRDQNQLKRHKQHQNEEKT